MAAQPTNAMLQSPPPQSLEAEQSVLGAMLIERDAIIRAGAILTGTDFYRDAHRSIFEAMMAMQESGDAVDLITLSDALTARGVLAEIGGMAYLTTLASAVPTAANVEHYARIVQQASLRRQGINDAQRLIAQLAEGGEVADRIINAAAGRLMSIAAQATRDSHRRTLSEILATRLDQYEAATERKGLTGWPTGLSRLDEITGGLQPGEVTVLAARPSIGKSTLALQIAMDGARVTRQAVYYASCEMPAESLADRIIGRESGIQPQKLRSGDIHGDAQWRAISQAIGRVGGVPLMIDDGELTTQSIWSACRRIQLERPLGFIVIDYLQLLSDRAERGQNEVGRVTDMSRRVKQMARDLRVPVLCLSQLNRASEKENRPPRLSDLRESGAIEQDADVVVFLHTPEGSLKQDPRPVQLMVSKNRNGGIGDCALTFFRAGQRMALADMRHDDPPPERRQPRQNRLGEYDEEDEHGQG